MRIRPRTRLATLGIAVLTALTGAIVPGFDFIRNQVAITSDLGSVSQSTAAILERSGAA